MFVFFFFQAEDGIRDLTVTGVQTCALPISHRPGGLLRRSRDRPGDDTAVRRLRRALLPGVPGGGAARASLGGACRALQPLPCAEPRQPVRRRLCPAGAPHEPTAAGATAAPD